MDSSLLFPQHLDDAKPNGAINEAVQQLAFSDLILLNKVDLVTEEQKQEVLAAIKHVNNTARVIECQLNVEDKRPRMSDVSRACGGGSISLLFLTPLSHTHTGAGNEHLLRAARPHGKQRESWTGSSRVLSLCTACTAGGPSVPGRRLGLGHRWAVEPPQPLERRG